MIATYARVSSDEQKAKETIEAQRTELRRFCDSHQFQVVPYEDDGISGTIALELRPGGKRLLSDIRAGKVDRVLAWRLDRLGREMFVLVSALHEIEGAGAEFESVTEGPLSLKDPTKILMTAVHSGMSAQEKATIRVRTMLGSRASAERGFWCGGPAPYGFSTVPDPRNPKRRRLEISTEPIAGRKMSQADVIRLIFKQAARGDSCIRIAEHLNGLGLPPSPRRADESIERATSWSAGRIRNLIIAPVYAGIHTWGRRHMIRNEEGANLLRVAPSGQQVQRAVPAIVDNDLWEKANAALRANAIERMAHPRHFYLLRGLIQCGACGHRFIGTAAVRNGRASLYYRCRNSQFSAGKDRCLARSIRGAELEHAIWEDISGFLRKPGMVIKQLRAKMSAGGDDSKHLRAGIKELEQTLVRNLEARKRADAHLVDGRLTPEAFDSQVQRLNAAARGLREELARLRKQVAEDITAVSVLKTAETILKDLGKLADGELSPAQKRQIIMALVERISVDGQARPKVEISYRFDPDFQRVHKGWGASDADLQRWHRGWAQEDGLALDNGPWT